MRTAVDELAEGNLGNINLGNIWLIKDQINPEYRQTWLHSLTQLIQSGANTGTAICEYV